MRLVGGGIVGNGGQTLRTVSIYAKCSSTPTSDTASIYYRINGGSWVLIGTTTTTTCTLEGTVNNVPNGALVEVVVENNTSLPCAFNANNTNTCPISVEAFQDDRSGSCGFPYSLTVDSNEDIAITIPVTAGNFTTFCA